MSSKDYSDEVAPLSKEEKAWLKSLERVLLKCPDRLCLQTIGDPYLEVIDYSVACKYNLETHDGKAHTHGIHLETVWSKCVIWAVSG